MDIEKIISKMTLEQKVGQLCVPILQKDNITDDLRYFIEERHIGFLRFCPNAEFDNASVIVGEPNKYFSAGEMAEFLNSVQKLAIDTTGVPLFISVDQEGSIRNDVNRAGAFAYSGHMSFGAAGDPELTYKIAKATAKEFRSMGINHVQAPICDVLRYPGRKTMKSSVFAEDQQTVTDHAFAMMKGLQDGGVSSMCKHFPGYGSLATDAHKGVAEITKDLETLEKEDLVPFIKLCTNGVNGIMIGHVVTHCIDDVVATVSPKVIKEYLRGKIGFDGIVMTDAMRMHAIQDIYGTGPASVMAVQAGCDLVLLRGSKEHFDDGYNALLEAAKNGVLSIEDIDASIRRVLTQKQRVGVLDNPYADPAVADATVGCAEHKALSKKLASSSITTLKKKIIPLKDEGQKVLAISVEPQKIAAAMDDI
ncbi:MAG: glycoside hydrolase family 3 protein, partial [Clostridia bacterium]|nr:glycoside hydrolase family 3 protein [Clostridia bacterium]